jgi:hypothetical protein
VQAPPEQDHDPRLQVVDHGAKLGEGAHGTRSHSGVLQDDPVVDVADVLAGVRSLGPFVAQEVEDLQGGTENGCSRRLARPGAEKGPWEKPERLGSPDPE